MKMKLEKYIQLSIRELKLFEEFWKAENKNNPEFFPEDLEPGQWDEQFYAFSSGEDGF